jgi:hypothetical protein
MATTPTPDPDAQAEAARRERIRDAINDFLSKKNGSAPLLTARPITQKNL